MKTGLHRLMYIFYAQFKWKQVGSLIREYSETSPTIVLFIIQVIDPHPLAQVVVGAIILYTFIFILC